MTVRTMESTKTAVIVGVGPGLGASLGRQFVRAGYRVALMARRTESFSGVLDELQSAGAEVSALICDATLPQSVEQAFLGIREEFGAPDVLVYNAGEFTMGGVLEIDVSDFERCLAANCTGALLTAQQVLPGMLERGHGSILLTGATASLRGSKNFACLAAGKFGLRALAQSMAREFGPQGVHVAHVIIDGQINIPGRYPERDKQTLLAPDDVARTYVTLAQQPRSTWTLELDLRPHVEQF